MKCRTRWTGCAVALALGMFATGAIAAATQVSPAVAKSAPHAAGAARPRVLPWIEDDWPRAVALAKQRKVPIFVESWAPW